MDVGNCLSRKTSSEIQIFLCCFFFGFTYVGQKQANMRDMNPYSFTAVRFIISTVFLYSIRAPLKDAIESDISDEKKGTHPSNHTVCANQLKHVVFYQTYLC
jgi:hypothetical protein